MALHALSIFAVAITFFARCIFASPIETLERRAIDANLFDNLGFFAQFATAAYCPDNNSLTRGGPKVMCPAGTCPRVEANDVITVHEFENSIITDVTGYIAIDRTRDLTVIAFRGSRSIRNWATNINFVKINTDICSGCIAHVGFWKSWLEGREKILEVLMRTANEYPSSKVVVVGHSLGGAIATLAAAEIRKKGKNVDLYTYGAPRVGGDTLSNFITKQDRGGNFRVTHTNDPVLRLPPMWLDFSHISPEYWIMAPNNVVPTPNDIQRIDGVRSLDGNAGQSARNFDAHGWYFGQISNCNPGDGGIEFKD